MKTLFTALLLLLPFVTRTAAAEVRVYKGTSTFTSDIVCTVRDGKVYKRTSSFTSDVIATVRSHQIYKGTSSFRSDVLFTVDGYLTVEEFFAVWHAVRYVY